MFETFFNLLVETILFQSHSSLIRKPLDSIFSWSIASIAFGSLGKGVFCFSFLLLYHDWSNLKHTHLLPYCVCGSGVSQAAIKGEARLCSFLERDALCSTHTIWGRILIFAFIGKRSFLAGCSQGPLSGPGNHSQFHTMWPSTHPHNKEVTFQSHQNFSDLWAGPSPLSKGFTVLSQAHPGWSPFWWKSTDLGFLLPPQKVYVTFAA